MKAITTQFHGATGKHGARVTAQDGDGNRYSMDTGLSDDPHLEAAAKLAVRMKWHPVSFVRGGLGDVQVFVIVDKQPVYHVDANGVVLKKEQAA